jgi:glutaredoxin
MMTLYSGITCPFSHRCRFVLYEKGMDFEIIDVDMMNKPEDIAVMNPYNRVPVLVERELILYESNIINEYIDERFPHPQLMPADPVMRARARLFISLRRSSFRTCRRLKTAAHKNCVKKLKRTSAKIWSPSRRCSPSKNLCWVKSSRCLMSLSPRCSGAWITTKLPYPKPPPRC